MSTIEVMRKALEALEEIALAGMSGTGQESEDAMRDWHARQAWKFIGIAARQLDELRAEIERLEATPGPTCQTFGDGIAVPCAECNTVLVDSQELAELRAKAARMATVEPVAWGATVSPAARLCGRC